MSQGDSGGQTPLLGPDEPPAFEWINPQGSADALLVCDHASNRIPLILNDLGLGADQLARHIAWDPGAAEVARGLAARLDAPVLLGGYSRLAIDLNRPLASPESIAERSDGVSIPGNRALSPAARSQRIAALFDPYHQAIERLLDKRVGQTTVLLSIHSFSPVLGAQRRPWEVGVGYGRDPRLARTFLQALRRPGDVLVGDNEPYGVEDEHDYTLPNHGEGRGIGHVMIEMRQDGLTTASGIAGWVDRLFGAWEYLGTRIETL